MNLPHLSHLPRYVAIYLATAIVMAGAAIAVGANLGAFFAGLALCALLLPWAMSHRASLREQFLAGACVVDAIALIWLVLAIADERITLLYWLKAFMLLLAMATFQFGLVITLRRLRCPGVLPAAVGVLLMLSWLAAPVWLLHHLQTPGLLPWMQRLIDIHPLFAMNSAVPLGVWTESPLAYRILNLNQDVYYRMPGSWLASLVHSAVGAVLIWVNTPWVSRLYNNATLEIASDR